MSLTITGFDYYNFRNYARYTQQDLGNITLFIGPNAVGKTNILEGLHLTTALRSFRNPKTEHLVRFNEQSAYVQTFIGDDVRALDVKLTIQNNKRAYTLNGKRRAPSTIRGILPAVTFIPDDLALIKGPHAQRRTQLDELGAQLSQNYYAVMKDYLKIVRQKNHYLKNLASPDVLVSINEVLASIGAHYFVMRSRILHELIPYIQTFYTQISKRDEEVAISLVPSWLKGTVSDDRPFSLESPEVYKSYNVLNTSTSFCSEDTFHVEQPLTKQGVQEELIRAMQERGQKEYDRHISLFGPHADHINVFINNRNAQQFASQGQQRSLVLAYKLAEVTLIKDRLNQSPVLLLDDVMSELDADRRESLFKVVSDSVQTFISSTTLSYFSPEILDRAQVIHLDRE